MATTIKKELSNDDILRLVSILRPGYLKEDVIKEVKQLVSEDTIQRDFEMLVNLAGHPCGQYMILSYENNFIKNGNNPLDPVAPAIALILVQGFDVFYKDDFDVDFTTGKVTIKRNFPGSEAIAAFNTPYSGEGICQTPSKGGNYKRRSLRRYSRKSSKRTSVKQMRRNMH